MKQQILGYQAKLNQKLPLPVNLQTMVPAIAKKLRVTERALANYIGDHGLYDEEYEKEVYALENDRERKLYIASSTHIKLIGSPNETMSISDFKKLVKSGFFKIEVR